MEDKCDIYLKDLLIQHYLVLTPLLCQIIVNVKSEILA